MWCIQHLPVIIPIVNGSSELYEAFVQGVGHSVHPFRYYHFSLSIIPLQVYNIPLERAPAVRTAMLSCSMQGGRDVRQHRDSSAA